MNRVLIFAGGKGTRMNRKDDMPKQFLEIDKKPIIIYTLEKFEQNELVDDIIVVCIKEWINHLEGLIKKFKIKKVSKILPGGKTGFDSRLNGLEYLMSTSNSDDDIVLIHDGVRPLINNQVITDNIKIATNSGNAITSANVTETIIFNNGTIKDDVLERDRCFFARAPQTFKLKNIYEYYRRAKIENKTEIIDSASLAYYYGERLNYVIGPQENIKITTPIDFYCAKGMLTYLKEDSKE